MPLEFSSSVVEIKLFKPAVAIDFLNNGNLVAIAMATGAGAPSVSVFESQTGNLVGDFFSETDFGLGVCFISKKEIVALVEHSSGETVDLLRVNVSDGKVDTVTQFPQSSAVRRLVRTQDSRFVAVSGMGFVEVIMPSDGSTIRIVQGDEGLGIPIPTFDSTGHSLYAANLVSHKVIRWDLAENQETGRWDAPQRSCRTLEIARDGQTLCVAGTGVQGGMYIVDTQTGEHHLPALYSSESSPDTVGFLRDGRYLTRRLGSKAGIIDITTGNKIYGPKLPRGRAEITRVAWDADVIGYALPKNNSVFVVHLVSN